MSEKQRKIIWYILLGVCAVIMLVVLVGAGVAMHNNAAFTSTNGDYQTYNIVRRMRAGKLPFRDYVNYLGIGVMQLVGAAAMLLGNTLVASKTAVSLLCYTVLWLEMAVLLYLITRRKLAAVGGATVLFCLSAYSETVWYSDPVRYTEFSLAKVAKQDLYFGDLLAGGNSLRPLRIALPFLIAAALLLIFRYYRPKRQGALRPYYVAALLATVAAFARLWTNDVGLVFVLVSLVVFVVFRARRSKQFAIELGVWCGVYLAVHFITVLIFTGGHYADWWEYNSVFGGVSEYQTWYYLQAESRIFTWQEFLRYIVNQPWPQWIVLLYSTYLLVRTRCTGAVLRFRAVCGEYCLAVAGFTVVFSNWVYYLKSSVFPAYDSINNLYAVCLIVGYGGMALRGLCARRVSPKTASAVMCAVMMILTVGMGVAAGSDTLLKVATVQPRSDTYCEVMGGNNSDARHIARYAEQVGDGAVFSTYASALEDTLGVLQPSKADYIIHALGDSAREEYLQAYHDANADFVTTINPAYNFLEYWCMRANWFFYREMLAEYQPIDTEGYLVLWEKADVQQPDTAAYTAVIDAGTVHISTAATGEPTIVDLRLSYETGFNGRLMQLLSVNSEVSAVDAWTSFIETESAVYCYSLPAGTQTVNVPVYVDENGEGSIRLSAYPYERSHITITDAQIDNAYVAPAPYRIG